MKITYNVTGAQRRKELVKAVAEIIGSEPVYKGAPIDYEVGGYHIDKNGVVTGPDNLDLESSLNALHGFEPAEREYDNPDTYESALGGMIAKPSIEELNELWAESEMRRMKLENANVPDYSNRGQYGGDDISAFDEPQMTEGEELGLGKERRDCQPGSGTNGENGVQASESYTYQAELGDPDCPDRMEVYGAENDEDALRQAYEFCEGDVVLLELFQLDEDYNTIRSVEITPRTDRLTIEIPLNGFTPEKLDNLAKLVNAKSSLLKAALGTDDLPIKQTADTLQFPWFRGTIDAEHTEAYAALISLLCKAAIEKKRVTAKGKDGIANPKYAMRCFILSIGFIGDEYVTARKILLKNLSGSSAFKSGARSKAEVPADE